MEHAKMLDWTQYRSEVKSRVGEMRAVAPDAINAYLALGASGAKAKHIDAKTRELISLAVAVTTRCDGCIASHIEAGLAAGLSKEELTEALGVAIAMNAGAALVYSARAFDCFEQLSSK